MKDKNGVNITPGTRCLINDSMLGLVTGFKDNDVCVLVLADGGKTCNEQLFKCDELTIKA